MMLPNAWAATGWLVPVIAMLVVAAAAVVYSYLQTATSSGLRWLLVLLKVGALALMAICLLEPVYQFTRPEPGANLLMLMVDDSQSLQIKDRGDQQTREQRIRGKLTEDARWLNQLSETFDLRRYQFDQSLRPVSNFSQYAADRRGTQLLENLSLVSKRFEGRPAAGIVAVTDGNDSIQSLQASDQADILALLDDIEWDTMPPVYPVIVGQDQPAADIGITRVVSTQTNFETAPITISAELIAHGFSGEKVAVEMLDETGERLEKKEVASVEDGRRFIVRFQTRPKNRGVNVYQIRAYPASLDANRWNESSTEATLVNNEQLVVVNRGRGPYRVLYVCGRPNWELKFLQRAMLNDPEVDLVSLIRIAKREAKFTFRGRAGQQSNSLFRGYESQDDDTTEQHDEPVFIRIGTRDSEELRGGFPKDPEALFQYDAIILDDVEADFFDADQQALLQQFVTLRGGGLLMMGGQESFGSGGFDRTPIGEMMPVYLDRLSPSTQSVDYRLDLTREGWLQPWVRIESTEPEERKRLQRMPSFRTINRTDSIKPGATVLATVSGGGRENVPALVVQPFGKGRVASMLIGDFWRWYMHTDVENNDLFKSWRQTTRWLVADVPRRVELKVTRDDRSATANSIEIRVRDETYVPYDNARIELSVETPDDTEIKLSVTPAAKEAGVYESSFAANRPGVYRAIVDVSAEDGSPIERREIGWVCDPDRDEFNSLTPNRSLMKELARRSGGEVIELDQIDGLPEMLESKPVPISQRKSLPWWHRWSIFGVAVGMLVVEWGIRRWKGLP